MQAFLGPLTSNPGDQVENLSRSLRYGLMACALAVWGSGCDDSTGTPPGDADDGVGGSGGSPEMGMGGMGASVQTSCTEDADCEDPADYCQKDSPDDVFGTCEEGCRLDPDSCPDGQHCEDPSHVCVDDPCREDADCPDAQYCENPGDDGECVDGCREGGDCPLADSGHDQTCDTDADPRACVPVIPCCSNEGMCTMGTSCDDTPVPSALSCEGLFCESRCDGDVDCADADTYCNPDGVCAEGCRDDSACNPDEVCNDKHECEEAPCEDHDDCPDTHYCDDDGTCHQGCRDNDGCGDGEVCEDNACVDDICESNDDCPEGRHCFDEACIEDCGAHGDCIPGAFCNLDAECQIGCRDDAWEENDTIDVFFPADGDAHPFLEMPPADGNGFQRLLVESNNGEPTKLCTNPPEAVGADFYGVTLPQAFRMRVELRFDEGLGNLNLRLHGGDLDNPLVRDGLDNPEAVEYPDLNAGNDEADYFIEVYGDVENEIPYELLVIMGDGACFPDANEDNNDPGEATPIADANVPGFRQDGLRVCGGDEDWWTLQLDPRDGLEVTVTAAPGAGDLRLAVYDPDRIARADFANPNFEDILGEDIGGGETVYHINEPEDGAINVGGDWQIVLEGASLDDQADYRVEVVRTGGVGCPAEQDELQDGGNDGVAGATDLDAIDAITDGGVLTPDADLVVPGERALCPQGDVDWFCFSAGGAAGDALEAWIDCDEIAGRATVRLTDEGGNDVGMPGSCEGDGGDSARASARVAEAGTYCIQVAAVAAAQGTYSLNVRREPVGDELCAIDEDEPPRNDSAGNATEMEEVDGSGGTRFQHATGVICDPAAPDTDWYSFPVANERSSVCLMLEGFVNDAANLDMEVYRDAQVPGANPCGGGCAEGLQCIQGRCAPHRAGGSAVGNRFDVEDVFLSRGVVGDDAGDHLVRVFRGAGGDADAPYTLTASVIPDAGADDVCPDDVYEPNDEAPFQLGDGEKARCDMWACEAADNNAFRDVDKYEITVPADQDRTVLIEYLNGVEGRLFMTTTAPTDNMMDPFAGIRASQIGFGNFQCINIRSSDVAQDVKI